MTTNHETAYIYKLAHLLGAKPKQVFNTNRLLGRNDKCPCESGKKYKKCCGDKL